MTETELRDCLHRARESYVAAIHDYDAMIARQPLPAEIAAAGKRRDRAQRDIQVAARQLINLMVGHDVEIDIKVERVICQ